MRATARRRAVVALVVAGVCTGPAVDARPRDVASPRAPTEQLAEETGGRARLERHANTGAVRFLGTPPDRPVPRRPGVQRGAPPEEHARALLREYGSVFGITNESRQLQTRETRQASGGATVRFAQVHDGVPVLGGELLVHMDAEGNTRSVNGEVLPAPAVAVTPRTTAASAADTARRAIAKTHGVVTDAVDVAAPSLALYSPALLGGPGLSANRLVWRTEASARGHEAFRETVLVDASRGSIVLHFDQLAHAASRYVCDRADVRSFDDGCAAPYARAEGDAPTGSADVDLAYDYMGDTDVFFAALGRDSVDGAGLPLKATVRFCPPVLSESCPWANAYWNGSEVVLGSGLAAADDVVAHELTHAVTEFESRLFYYYQSGAINESLSDVFGELVDLTNAAGDDDPTVRWLLGEDAPGGALRNLADPTEFGQPDRMTSPAYSADEVDGGGVHTNSGVNNKAASLLVDGGTFNGYTVTGLGIPKVARLYYAVATDYLTSASDYRDLGSALRQACQDLVGRDGFVVADCAQVTAAVAATEMDADPADPAARTVDAPLCPEGQVPVDQFHDDIESGSHWMTPAYTSTDAWYVPQNPNPYVGWDPTYATSGEHNMWGDDGFTRSLHGAESRVVRIPGRRRTYLHFNHAYSFEYADAGGLEHFDGGVVEYSLDWVDTWYDASPFFTHGGYTGTISSDYDNPLAGREGFVASSHGYGSSRLDLTPLAGHHVRLRFLIGTDSDLGFDGWFVDDVRLYTCAPSATGPTGDFNGDGYADLAVGVPGENVGRLKDAGGVYVLYGGPGGLTRPKQYVYEDAPDVVGRSEAGDRFGAAVAAGDFDADGRDDLVIGAPGQDIGRVVDAGKLHVIYGSTTGLNVRRSREITQDSPSVPGAAERGDGFGATLAVGDFDGDTAADLAAGAPTEDVGAIVDGGSVSTFLGSQGSGLGRSRQLVQGDSASLFDAPETNDRLGEALAAGDFHGLGTDVLVIGAPREDVGGATDAGIVHMVRAESSLVGWSGIGSWTQSSLGVDAVESGDRFGASLAAGWFDTRTAGGRRRQDLAIGAPLEDVAGVADAGAVAVVLGSPRGLQPEGAQWLTQSVLAAAGGSEPGDRFGSSLAITPSSLVVGAPYEDTALVNAGALSVIQAGADGLSLDNPAQLLGNENSDRLAASLAAGDFNRDGLTDTAAGVPGETVSGYPGAGMVAFYRGQVGGALAPASAWYETRPETGDSVGASVASGIS